MTRWSWPSGGPRFPLAVAGYGQIDHAYLGRAADQLVMMAGAAPAIWGLLFVVDARFRRWTLYSPDPDYTTMFAPAAHVLDLDRTVFAAKFPGWNAGWRL